MPLFRPRAASLRTRTPSPGPWYVPMYPPLSFLAYAPALARRETGGGAPDRGRGGRALRDRSRRAARSRRARGSRRNRSSPRARRGPSLLAPRVARPHGSLFRPRRHARDSPRGRRDLAAREGRRGAGAARPSSRPPCCSLSRSMGEADVLPCCSFRPSCSGPPRGGGRLLCLSGAPGPRLLWAVLFGALFGARNLAFWTVEFSARHPWTGPPLGRSRTRTGSSSPRRSRSCSSRPRSSGGSAPRRAGWAPLATSPVAVLVLAALLLWPASVIGYVKVGGAVNSFIPTLFFLSAPPRSAPRGAAAAGPVRAALVAAGIVLAAQSALDATAAVRHALRGTWDADFAFEAVRRDPAHVVRSLVSALDPSRDRRLPPYRARDRRARAGRNPARERRVGAVPAARRPVRPLRERPLPRHPRPLPGDGVTGRPARGDDLDGPRGPAKVRNPRAGNRGGGNILPGAAFSQ